MAWLRWYAFRAWTPFHSLAGTSNAQSLVDAEPSMSSSDLLVSLSLRLSDDIALYGKAVAAIRIAVVYISIGPGGIARAVAMDSIVGDNIQV